MHAETVFLSAVTSEFKSIREALRSGLSGIGRRVIAAEDDPNYRSILALAQDSPEWKKQGGTTLNMLFEFVKNSSLVIHVIGNFTGDKLNSSAVEHFHLYNSEIAAKLDRIIGSRDWSEISYTQLEAYLAHCLGCKLILVVAKGFASNTPSNQQEHLNRLKSQEIYPTIESFEDATDLENKIWQIRSVGTLFDQPVRLPDLSRMPKIYGEVVGTPNPEDGDGSSTFSVADLIDISSLADRLKQPTRAFDVWLAAQLSPSTQDALSNYSGPGSDPTSIQQSLLQDFNRIIRGTPIHQQQRFDGIELRTETKTLLLQQPKGEELLNLNRLLIEDAYPLEVSRNHGDSPRIFGRREEQYLIDKAWESHITKVIGFIAGGGIGKSTLVIDWLANFKPANRVAIFGYSFYLQGQTERQVDTDTFLNEIARYFEINVDAKAAPYAKGKFIAQHIMRERALIVLDGMEPLQEASTGRFLSEDSKSERSTTGSFTDNGARGFIETLALAGNQFQGLCILTSRIPFSDLNYLRSGNRYVERRLTGLEDCEGAAFLAHLGVKGTVAQRMALSNSLDGHALALLLTGTMIRDCHDGQIVDGTISSLNVHAPSTLGVILPAPPGNEPHRANSVPDGVKHTFKALNAYISWFQRDRLFLELNFLHILGLFDRSAEMDAVEAVRKAPAIPGLTEHAVDATPRARGHAFQNLAKAGLIGRTNNHGNGPVGFVDAHPLIRQFFSEQLKQIDNGSSFREGHRRLYQYYSQSTDDFPSNAPKMALLYRTIGHCCLAGEMKTAFEDLLLKRAWRSQSPQPRLKNFATRHLGMISADFVALTQFFIGELDDFAAHPDLGDKSRFTLLTDIAVRMRSLGRLQKAKEALSKALEGFTPDKMLMGYDGAYAAAQLSELELISGELRRAEQRAKHSIEFADQQTRTYLKFHARTSLADILMQKGDLTGASRLFFEALYIANSDPNVDPPFFYSQTCYRYGLYLIEIGKTDEFLDLVKQTRDWGNQRPHKLEEDGTISKGSLLSSAIDQLILSEAFVRIDETKNDYRQPTLELIDGITGSLAQLNNSGYSDYLARGLNIAARFHTGRGDFTTARTNLEQNREHVHRGQMRLLQADYLIETCRYHIARSEWEHAQKHHRDAIRLADEIGYGRRKAELRRFAEAISQKQPEAFRQR